MLKCSNGDRTLLLTSFITRPSRTQKNLFPLKKFLIVFDIFVVVAVVIAVLLLLMLLLLLLFLLLVMLLLF